MGITELVLVLALGMHAQETVRSATLPTHSAVTLAPNPFQPAPGDPHRDIRETHLREVKQLTQTGSNAEAYWSWDGKRIIFQSTREGRGCDQIYVMNSDGSTSIWPALGRSDVRLLHPGNKRIVYANTHGAGADCPPALPRPEPIAVFSSYDLYTSKPDGSDVKPCCP